MALKECKFTCNKDKTAENLPETIVFVAKRVDVAVAVAALLLVEEEVLRGDDEIDSNSVANGGKGNSN